MTLENILPTTFNWDNIVAEKSNGETGFATIKSQTFGTIKIRQVEYSANYLADHWCEKGHIVFVISGQLIIGHADKSVHVINKGSTYIVGDNTMSHKAESTAGAVVLIVD